MTHSLPISTLLLTALPGVVVVRVVVVVTGLAP